MPDRTTARGLAVGDEVEVDVTAIAHGGHCVARHEGQVLFVRHALPGERVRRPGHRDRRRGAVRPGGCRRGASTASPGPRRPRRARAPARALCGGCDLQHVALPRQRALKADVVARADGPARRTSTSTWTSSRCPGTPDGLDWRTRVEFAVDAEGRAGLRRHRSHDVVPIDHCRIAAPGIDALRVTERAWPRRRARSMPSRPPIGEPLAVAAADAGARRPGRPRAASTAILDRRRRQRATRSTTSSRCRPGGSGRCTRARPHVPVAAVLGLARAASPGSGPSTSTPASACSPSPSPTPSAATGQVLAVEADAAASRPRPRQPRGPPNVAVLTARVDDAFGVARPSRRGSAKQRGSRPRKASRSALMPAAADVVVLDPPRTGAGRGVCAEVAALRPRVVVYVACDPAALARDTAYLAAAGYRLDALRAFDAFPMTHHVECVARFVPARPGPGVRAEPARHAPRGSAPRGIGSTRPTRCG